MSGDEVEGLREASEVARRELAADRWEALTSELDVPAGLAELVRGQVDDEVLVEDPGRVREYLAGLHEELGLVERLPLPTRQRMEAQRVMSDAVVGAAPAVPGRMLDPRVAATLAANRQWRQEQQWKQGLG